MSKPVMCPSCWHLETFQARHVGREPCRDDPTTLRWEKPYGGARGQTVTPWDNGGWSCETCGFRAPAEATFLLIDAVLHLSDPDCDSIDDEGIHADAKTALNGGGR